MNRPDSMVRNELTKSQFLLFLFFVLLLSCFTVIRFHPGNIFVIGDDGYFHLNRFAALGDAIYSGNFPFYIDSKALGGYGYATNLFYPDFMLIPFALLIPVTGSVWAFKIMLIFYTLLCVLFSYYAARRVSGNVWVALLFAVLYSFSYYRIADMSFRTALGEFLAFTFIPLVFWGGYEILYGKIHRWYILSIAFACLILSHLVSSLLLFLVMCCFLIIYIKRLIKEPKRIFYFFLAGGVTILLVAFFILPMYEQIRSADFYFKTSPFVSEIKYSAIPFRNVVKGFLIGFTNHIKNYQDSYIGVGALLSALLLLRFFIKKKNRNNDMQLADIFTIVGFFFILMITDLFPWGTFPFNHLKVIQFPWRLFQPVSFLFAFSGAVYLVALLDKSTKKNRNRYTLISCSLLLCCLLWGTVCTSEAFIETKKYRPEQNFYTGGDTRKLDYIGIGQEYMPSAVPSVKYITERGDKIVFKDSLIRISNFERIKHKISFDVALVAGTDSLELPLLYYKGYKAMQDNRELLVSQSANGLVQVSAVKTGHVHVSYTGTTIQYITLLLSVLSLLALIIIIFKTEFFLKTRKKATK